MRHSRPLVFAIALVVLATGCGGEATPESTTTTSQATTSTVPVVAETVWRQTVLTDRAAIGLLSGVAATTTPRGPEHARFVAVGNEDFTDDVGNVDAETIEVPTIWHSRNGGEWSRVEHDAALFPSPGRIRDVIYLDPGFLAVGTVQGDAAAWRSIDGYAWERIEDGDFETVTGDGSGVATGAEIVAVTRRGSGFVAVGSDGLAPAVWVSPDGSSWQRVPQDPVAFAGGTQTMFDVAAFDGRVVAVGTDTGSGVIWASTDGTDWERVAAPDGLFSLSPLFAVSSTDRGIFALGTRQDETGDILAATIWRSDDAASWDPLPDTDVTAGRRVLTGLTTLDDDLYAFGYEIVDGDLAPLVLRSSDGTDWVRVEDEAVTEESGYGAIFDVTSSGSGVVAVGLSGQRIGIWRTETVFREG